MVLSLNLKVLHIQREKQLLLVKHLVKGLQRAEQMLA